MQWGVIGTGNMGRVLIDAWLNSNAIFASDLWIHNRTLSKAYNIKEDYHDINVCSTAEKVVQKSDVIYICVKPLEIVPLLNRLSPHMSEKQCVVSITSPISVEQLDQLVPCQTARIIPSIINRSLHGVSLLTFGKKIEEPMKGYLIQSCKLFSVPVEIEEATTRVTSDIVSCGPAFFSYLLQAFVNAASDVTQLNKEDGILLAEKMIVGFGKLIENGHYSLESLQQKVTVKGGVTGEGLKVLEEELGEIFHHLFEATHRKFDEDKEKIADQL
ncbi:late competence protein ComER [Salirhabdus salicampi]|uniref:late competence protein ComER n=1 Tax=Salirhabdus salicampi TaxID=476102 RepID=UPI0020C1F51A|nr:late competence protein ComER [Salirhabdus salicampi]MCP8616928.1 late competence protein ComER [Salirhabdus salicampi]